MIHFIMVYEISAIKLTFDLRWFRSTHCNTFEHSHNDIMSLNGQDFD